MLCCCKSGSRSHLLAAFAGAGVTLGASALLALGPGHDDKDELTTKITDAVNAAEPEGMPDMDEMMEMMAKFAAPGEHHEELKKTVGTWDVVTTFSMGPGQEASGTGRMTTKMLLGDRYTHSDFKLDDFMGQPFEGIGIRGYNNVTRQHESVWFDTMSTGLLMMHGSESADGTLTMQGKTQSPMGEGEMKIKTKWHSDDKFVDTFHEKMPDGTWMQTGTIVYTRK